MGSEHQWGAKRSLTPIKLRDFLGKQELQWYWSTRRWLPPFPGCSISFVWWYWEGKDLAVDGFTSGPDRVKVVLQTCFSRLDSLCYLYLEALIRSTLSLFSFPPHPPPSCHSNRSVNWSLKASYLLFLFLSEGNNHPKRKRSDFSSTAYSVAHKLDYVSNAWDGHACVHMKQIRSLHKHAIKLLMTNTHNKKLQTKNAKLSNYSR